MSIEGIVQQKTLSHRRQRVLSNRRQRLLSNRRWRLLSNGRQRLTQSLTLSPKSIPTIIHLISRGSQTVCNRKLSYQDSCTLYKGGTLYLWVVISLLRGRLENLIFAILYTSFGVWHRNHYMLLQRSTTGVCHALLWFPTKAPLTVVEPQHTAARARACRSRFVRAMVDETQCC
jgi:hypothetical protein